MTSPDTSPVAAGLDNCPAKGEPASNALVLGDHLDTVVIGDDGAVEAEFTRFSATGQESPLDQRVELFENAFQHAAIGMALVGLDGRFLKINRAFCALLGYPQSHMLTLDFQSITHPDDLDADLTDLSRLRAGEIPSYSMDKRYFRADGSIVWVRLTASLIAELDGSPKHFIAQVQDLTESRQAEARYRMLAENATDMIGLHDISGEYLYVSPSCERLLGYTPSQMIGRRRDEFMPAKDRAAWKAANRRLRKLPLGTPTRLATRMYRQDGSLAWVEVVARLAEGDDGDRVIITSTRDVTDRV
ncbi:MAG: domain S-box protein, partial [Caulobacteraceae bacterium]|nr:domain S-box protein [Caulobacteraceae bacterium]